MVRNAARRRRGILGLLASGFLAALVLSALAGPAGAVRPKTLGDGGVVCPVTAGELSALTGKQLQRANLGSPDGDASTQCAFSAVSKGTGSGLVSPQVFLTFEPGGAADLRALYRYYLDVRGKLATRPSVSLRPEFGNGAFALTTPNAPVSSVFFLVDSTEIATLVVDLANAAPRKRDQVTAEKIFTLVVERLS